MSKFVPEKPQEIMIEHLLTHDAAFNIVGMGIGKTASCLAAANELFHQLEITGVLVIAPMRVCNLTWPMEVSEWDEFRWMKVANLRTQLGRRAFIAGVAHIYLINYESIPLLVELVKKRGGTLPYDVVIYDESTKAKNPKSKRIRMLRNDVPTVKRRWALTGTPMPNSLMDLHAQVRLLDDGKRLGPDFHLFKRNYFHPTDWHERVWAENLGAEEEVQRRISDITLTLRSSDWLTDVPDADVEDVEIAMPDKLRDQYLKFEKELILELTQSVEITAANAAVLVSKLLQFTSGACYDADKKWHPVHDHKIKALGAIAKRTKSPLLVACAFKHEQERIRREFPQARFFADAKTPAMQMALLKQWNERKVPMLVAHPKSIGHGLNLQKGGNTMVWMSLTYSRESYEQMIARLVRRGQHDVVKVYRLMVPGTVDDAVAAVLQNKRTNEQRVLKALMLLEGARELPTRLTAGINKQVLTDVVIDEPDFL